MTSFDNTKCKILTQRDPLHTHKPRGCQSAPPIQPRKPHTQQPQHPERSKRQSGNLNDKRGHKLPTQRAQPPPKVNQPPGGHSLMAPPGPIPNPEVKHQHVDGSRTIGPARVDSCQDSRSPRTERFAGFSYQGVSLDLHTARSAVFTTVLRTVLHGGRSPLFTIKN